MANLGTFDSIEQARAAFGESASSGDYVLISGVNYYWNPLELNWFTERYTVTTPVYDIPETTDKGAFASMDAVWAAFPNGGSEGDYLTIGSDRYHWNKWEQLWESSGETQVPVVNHYVTNLGTFATMDEVWNLYPDGGHDGEWLTINSIRYYWDIYNQLWASEDGTATYLELHDVTNRGSYTDIEAVYSALPNGGAEGDYIYIDGIKYRWNKYTHVWMGVPDEPAAGRTNYNFNGDVTIQNNLTVGGILRAKGMITKYDRIYQYLLQSTSDFESSTNKTVDDFKKEVSDALSQAGKSADNAAYANEASLAAEAINLTKDSPEWDKILRKDIPNNAQELIRFLKGIAFGDGPKGIDAGGNATLARIIATELSSPNFLSSLYNGLGWRMDENGVLECDGIKVRSSMEIMELIINRLSAIEGDQLLTEGDTIEAVTEIINGDGSVTYRLQLKSKWDGYFTAQVENNVLKGIINTLSAGSGEYHTSWMRVLSVDTVNNTIDVLLYPDVETPSGANYKPVAMMNISRWGNATDKTRQSCIYLSSTEGRIAKLAHVTKPIIDKGNYGFVIGDMPDWLKDNTAISLKPGVDYIYLGGLIYDDLIHVPYQGKQDPVFVDRGQWTSTPSEPYHCETRNSLTGVYETSDVWHFGCKFRCITDAPTSEPKWNSTDWAMIEGNPAFWIEIDSSRGDYFDVENFATTLSIVAWIYNQEVTSDILDADVVWERYTEDSTGTQRVAADASWNSNHTPSKTLALTREDIGIYSAGMPRVLRFKATATLQDGITSTAEIIYS